MEEEGILLNSQAVSNTRVVLCISSREDLGLLYNRYAYAAGGIYFTYIVAVCDNASV